MRTVSSLIPCIALFFVLSGCAVNPVTGVRELRLISTEQEIAIGRQQYGPARQGCGGDYLLDPQLGQYVAAVGQRLAQVSDRPELPYEFRICNDSTPNAWALPGGKIAVNRGLLVELENESELAAVLAHEIVHSAARHSAKALERGLLLQLGSAGIGLLAAGEQYQDIVVGVAALGAQLINQKYTRDQEREADLFGMRYMARAGYDPYGAVSLQEKLLRLNKRGDPSWLAGLFASHPPSAERLAANRAMLGQLPTKGERGAARYQRRIAGLLAQRPAYDAYDEGRRAWGKGEHDQALRLADKAIGIEPREALFYGLRGDVLLARGKKTAALAAYGQALARNPNYYRFHQQRGLVLWQMGRRQEARHALERAIALLPTAAAHYLLGDILAAAGKETEAARHFAAAAADGSAIGEAARARLAVIELRRTPEHFLRGRLIRQADGELWFELANQAPVTVQNVTVRVRLVDAAGRQMAQHTFSLRSSLKPKAHSRFWLATSMPPAVLEGLQLDYRITSFAIAGKPAQPF